MEQPASSNCAACGKPQEQVRKLISVGGPALCDECIHAYGTALRHALEEDSRARAGESVLIAAEEMALDLIDALETTRAEQADRELQDEIEQRARKLRLVHEQEAAAQEQEPESAPADPAPSEPEEEFPSEAEWAKAEAQVSHAEAQVAHAEAQIGGMHEGAATAKPAAEAAPGETSLAEPPRPAMRHCPWCTGNLEPLPSAEGAPPSRFRCASCGRQFDISQA